MNQLLMKKRVFHLGMTMLLSCWYLLATAQVTVDKCEYWFDYAYDSRTPIPITDGNWVQQLDVGTLQPGLHVMACHMGTSDGRWSSVLVKNILVPYPSSFEDNVLKDYEYWVDHDFEHKVSGTIAASGIIDLNLDFKTLSPGLHNIAFRVLDANGHTSSILVKNFLVPNPSSMEENVLKNYEYWVDHDFDHKVSGTIAASGIIDLNLDFKTLSPGLHNIAFRVLDANGHTSSILVKNFLVPNPSSTEENVLKNYEYWVDHDFDHKVSGTIASSGIIDLDIDFSALAPGLHNIAFRVLDANGHTSTILVKNFLVPEPSSMTENGLYKYRYWIDRDVANAVEVDAPADGIISLDFDASALNDGPHEFSYQVIDKVGHASATAIHHFIKETIQGEGKLIGVDYWFNDDPRTRIAIDPAQVTIDKNDIVISLDGVQPRSISEDYTFDATTKTVKTTETITLGLQVFNDAEVGSGAVEHTIENVTFTVTPLFEALVNEASSTQPAPKGGQVQGFSYASAVGDVLYWEITGSDAKVDFKDADGNAITPETKEIGGKTVLVVTMPTTTVYVLAYGATTDDDIVVKVAQPVELTVVGATRAYGDANPTFTYTSSGAAVAGEVVFTTTADATSAVGDYTVDIDLTGVTNTYVTVVAGKLTITPATLTVGVEDCSITQGEELPTFTLTYDGFKNGEDASVLTTQPTVTTEATASSAPGDYDLIVSGGEATNYTFAYTKGKLTIVEATGIRQVQLDRPVNVYTIGGTLVRQNATSLDGLPDGVYIVNGKKVLHRRKK